MKRLWLISVLLLGCSRNPASPTAPASIPAPQVSAPNPTPPFTLGYYCQVGDQPWMQDLLEEAPPWANMAIVGVSHWPLPQVQELAQRAKRARLWIVYSAVDSMQNLRVNLADEWANEQLPRVRAFADLGILHSVYIADEPVANGVPPSRTAQIARLVKASGYRTMLVEAPGRPHQPVDYFGISCYDHIGLPGSGSGCRSMYEADPSANVLVMPGFYSEGFQDGHRVAGAYLKWDQQPWGELALVLRSQGRLDAVAVFLWQSAPGLVGSRDDSDLLEGQHRVGQMLGVSR